MSLPFRTLGLGGGGIKGILHVGALLELSKIQELKFPNGVYGCSVGSIIATYIAFELPLDKMVPLMKKYLCMERMTPKFQIAHISSAFSAKGLYSMDTFEQSITSMFSNAGLDIQGKKLGDANMPLYIVASNITKGVPTLFSKNIGILDALKCSCCIPGVFRPIDLYGQMYVDGNLFAPCIASLVPKDALVLTLLKQRKRQLTPALIETMSPIAYLDELYIMTSSLFHDASISPNTLCLKYPNLHSDSDLSEFDIDAILKHAGSLFNQFITKRLL
jgi:predicted acylesterase/phospholipase RssA